MAIFSKTATNLVQVAISSETWCKLCRHQKISENWIIHEINTRCKPSDGFYKNLLSVKNLAFHQYEKIEELKNKDIHNLCVIKKFEEEISVLKTQSELLVNENEQLKICSIPKVLLEKETQYNQTILEKDKIIEELNCKLSQSVNEMRNKLNESSHLNKILKNAIADLSQQHHTTCEIFLKLTQFIVNCFQHEKAVSHDLISIRNCLLDYLYNTMNPVLVKGGETDLLGSIKRLIESARSSSPEPECALIATDGDVSIAPPSALPAAVTTGNCCDIDVEKDHSNDTSDGINLDNPNIPISFDNLNMFSDEEIGQSLAFDTDIATEAKRSEIPDVSSDNESSLEERINSTNFGNRSKHPHLINGMPIENESSSDNESVESNLKPRKQSNSSSSISRLEIGLETRQSATEEHLITCETNSSRESCDQTKDPKRRVRDKSQSVAIPSKRRKHDLQMANKEGIPESIIGCEDIVGPICDDTEADIYSSCKPLIAFSGYPSCKPSNLAIPSNNPPKTASELLSVDIDCPLSMSNNTSKPSSSSLIHTPNQTSDISPTVVRTSNNAQKSQQTIRAGNAVNTRKTPDNSPTNRKPNHNSLSTKLPNPQNSLNAIRAAEIEQRIKLAEKPPTEKPSQENLQKKLSETLRRLSEKKINSTAGKGFQMIASKSQRPVRHSKQQKQQADLMELRPITRENLVMERMTKQDLCDMKITQFKTDSISGTKRKRETERINSTEMKPKPKRNIAQLKRQEETKPVSSNSNTSKLLNVNLGQYLLRHQINEEEIIKHQQLVTFTAYNPLLPEPELIGGNRNAKTPEKQLPIKRTNQNKTISEFVQSKPKALENELFVENRIVNLFQDLMKENENDFIGLIGKKFPITTEIEAKLLIDAIFDFFKLNKDKLFKRTFLINAILQLIISIISRCQKVYSYFYSNLLVFIQSAETHSGLVVILSTVSFYTSLQQWDRIVGFFVDLLRLPNVFLLQMVSIVTPNNFFPPQNGTKYDSISSLFKRLVMYEYSTTSGDDCKKLFANTPIEVQKFWLSGQTVHNFQPMNDLPSIIELANQITEECKLKNFKFNLDRLDKDLEMKYCYK